MTDLESLISRLEQSTGPSRELDRLIGDALGAEMGLSGDAIGLGYPRYTASIDATMTLLGSKWEWAIDHYPDQTDFSKRYRVEISGYVPVHSASLEICICIASLRARQAETQKVES